MHDLKLIRENPDLLDAGLKRRNLPAQANDVLAIDKERRALQTQMQELQAKRNEISKKIGELKRVGQDASALMEEVAQSKEQAAALEHKEQEIGKRVEDLLATIPNIPASDVPSGKDEKDNKEVRRVGEPKRINSAKEHYEVGEKLGYMDFDTAAKLSGSRFTLLKGPLAQLERALANFMLDTHTREFGYMEMSPPLLVRDEIMYGTGQLPKFHDDQFKVQPHDLWLIPTAEVPLTNIVNNEIVDEGQLPLRFVAKTACFRAEAGAAGKDTRGMLRQHQFYKVELVSITTPDQSEAEHERMTNAAETILKKLDLPFRTVLLCTGDMGFASKKTYDIEVWLPGQNTYREISSCSNCGDFQARRMKARFRKPGDKNTQFLHTLNGSGVAVGRCLIAILENYQQDDGSVVIPEALRGYMGGLERITPVK
jgi:seryl-tRNA synthetase